MVIFYHLADGELVNGEKWIFAHLFPRSESTVLFNNLRLTAVSLEKVSHAFFSVEKKCTYFIGYYFYFLMFISIRIMARNDHDQN